MKNLFDNILDNLAANYLYAKYLNRSPCNIKAPKV